ncbi:hypothetical protein ACFQE0_01985 [Methylobacterium komagatae]|uniref:Uncharacterized protein n=1 Tax=Methylobacterium komagatae TaxID=374425 RepID=A0ABW2BEX1_9HYPH
MGQYPGQADPKPSSPLTTLYLSVLTYRGLMYEDRLSVTLFSSPVNTTGDHV